MPSNLSNFQESDIFNTDETGLFWRRLHNRTLTFKGTKYLGGKLSKGRIGVLVACNMNDTENLPLLVNGKYAKPRFFKSIKTWPRLYDSTQKAWISMNIFTM